MGIGSVLPSIHKSKGWQGQHQRMIRWYNKFKATNPGAFENIAIDEHHDILYACFQNIFHLKDWLINDAKVSKKIIYDYLDSHIELQLCRDICNGTKHFEITKGSAIEKDFTIIREYEPYYKLKGSDKNKIIILSGGYKYDLKELAWTCINLWEKFIQENNIK
jgi:hypothetical protein